MSEPRKTMICPQCLLRMRDIDAKSIETLEVELLQSKNREEELKQENEKLRDVLEYAYKYKSKYFEIKKYTILYAKALEALNKCDPYSNKQYTGYTRCIFCNAHASDEHKNDCEYVKLIGG